MDRNNIRFVQEEVLLFTMMNGKILAGKFLRGPQLDYDYWTLELYEDTSIVAIKASNIESIMRPSKQFLADYAAIQEIVDREIEENNEDEQ